MGETKTKNFILKRCKREDYIKAWKAMYACDKKLFNEPMFDGINPMLNKTPLATEINNYCVVLYDAKVKDEKFGFGFNEFPEGKPIGIFCMVVIKSNAGATKVIGKQYVLNPDYQGKGLGKAMLLELEKWLIEEKYDWYYIGCSSMSARIMNSFGSEAYSSDVVGDLYKFNVDLKRSAFKDQYKENVTNNKNLKVVK